MSEMKPATNEQMEEISHKLAPDPVDVDMLISRIAAEVKAREVERDVADRLQKMQKERIVELEESQRWHQGQARKHTREVQELEAHIARMGGRHPAQGEER